MKDIQQRFLSRRLVRLLCISASAAFMALPFTASAAVGYQPEDKGKLVVVSEPDNISQYVEYCVGGRELRQRDIPWVEGKFGQAVDLAGKGQFLRLWSSQIQSPEMTFSGWFYWRGPVEGQPEEETFAQRFFTFSSRDENWLTVYPHAKNPEITDESGKVLDGVMQELHMGGSREGNMSIYQYTPSESGVESSGLPINEWHHVAMVWARDSLKLYIDGALFAENSLLISMTSFDARLFTLGGPLDVLGNVSLNALVDEVYLYNYALDSDGIKMLAAGIDPLDENAAPPTTEPPYIPEAPSTTVPPTTKPTVPESSQMQNPEQPILIGTIFGLPKITIILVGSLLGAFVILCVGLNIYHIVHNRKIKKEESFSSTGPDPAEPGEEEQAPDETGGDEDA